MPLPPSLATKQLHIESVSVTGVATSGSVVLTVPQALRAVTDDVIIPAGDIVAVLNGSGEATVTVPVCDDPDVAPSGWAYTVSERFNGAPERTYQAQILSADPATVELADLAPVITPPNLAAVVVWGDLSAALASAPYMTNIVEDVVDAKLPPALAAASFSASQITSGTLDALRLPGTVATDAEVTAAISAAAAGYVQTTGAQAVGGVKTFSAQPVFSAGVSTTSVTASAAISAQSAAITNGITAASSTLTGALNANTAAITAGVTAATVAATGNVSGSSLTVATIAQPIVQTVLKTADQTVNNSIVLVDDTHLLLSVAANSTYLVEVTAFYTATINANIEWGWTVPASATMRWGVHYTTEAKTQADTLTGAALGTTTYAYHTLIGTLVTAGTAGTLRLRWAQDIAEATNTTMRTSSWMRLTKIA